MIFVVFVFRYRTQQPTTSHPTEQQFSYRDISQEVRPQTQHLFKHFDYI